MTTLGSPARVMLRGFVSLRGAFVWLLLALLIAGAASYTSGSRYALVPGDSQAVVHEAVPSAEPDELEQDCCERNKAPRGEPAPVRTGAVDPPVLVHRHLGDGTGARALPPEPELPSLTVVDLSISRT